MTITSTESLTDTDSFCGLFFNGPLFGAKVTVSGIAPSDEVSRADSVLQKFAVYLQEYATAPRGDLETMTGKGGTSFRQLSFLTKMWRLEEEGEVLGHPSDSFLVSDPSKGELLEQNGEGFFAGEKGPFIEEFHKAQVRVMLDSGKGPEGETFLSVNAVACALIFDKVRRAGEEEAGEVIFSQLGEASRSFPSRASGASLEKSIVRSSTI